jgi:Kdo2-lipid IVA lauroyltransferase/acyltransferase
MPFLIRLLSRCPLWLLHGAGWLLGYLVYGFSRDYRQRFQVQLQQAGYGWREALGAIGQAGCSVMESPRLWFGSPVTVQWDGKDVFQAAYAGGRGVIFLTPHLGCFEVTAPTVAAVFGERYGPMTVLYRPARQAWLATMLQASRSREGMVTVPTNLQGVRKLLKALRKGEAIGLLPDQVPPLGMGIWSPVWGRPAYTMTLAAKLVLQTGADVVVVWGERLAWGRGYCIHAGKLEVDMQADLEAMVAHLNLAMESLVRQRPAQYLWGYERYKQPRQEPLA